MQNPVQKFIESSFVFQKPGILSEKIKTLMSFNYNNFVEILHTFPTSLYFTSCFLFTLFRACFGYLPKKGPGKKTKLINNSRFKQDKEHSTHPFVDFDKTETYANFSQKY